MLELMKVVDRIASSRATILISGETGTGKELFARAIHDRSDRRDGPFCVVHCAALPESTLESELWGIASARSGRIAAAEHGTLFLDEISEIPLEIQAKLLRLIQFFEIQRLGADVPTQLDLRIVAATNRDLREQVGLGRFREDLYYRLNVVELRIPPLREHKEDIPLLVEHFLRVHGHERHDFHVFTARAREILLEYDYPGNVRELENIVHGCCIVAAGVELGEELLPAALREKVPRRSLLEPRELTLEGLR